MTQRLKKILVTGGAGFIGSEFVRQGVARGYRISVVDKLTYAGDLARIREIQNRIRFHKADIRQSDKIGTLLKKERPDVIVHFATETHVDRSILDAKPFFQTNVIGTQVLVEAALRHKIKKFIHISTDEVYGEIRRGSFDEQAPLKAGNPYSASKAAADLLIQAAMRTYRLPAVIIRPSNNYGPWQYPEKFMPVVLLKALNDQAVPVYGKGQQRREWLHVSDCCRAIFTVMRKGKLGGVYNVSSGQEQNNLKTARDILRALNKPEQLIHFVQDRPGHDFRYSLTCRKLKGLGWRPKVKLLAGIENTVAWNLEHRRWVEGKLRDLEKYWKKVYRPLKKT